MVLHPHPKRFLRAAACAGLALTWLVAGLAERCAGAEQPDSIRWREDYAKCAPGSEDGRPAVVDSVYRSVVSQLHADGTRLVRGAADRAACAGIIYPREASH